MKTRINLGAWGSVFAVPAEVVDRHLALCSGGQLKVLLYLLRHAEHEADTSDMAKALHLKESAVREALDYWVASGLICSENGAFSPAGKPEILPAGQPDQVISGQPPQHVVTHALSCEPEHNRLNLPPLPAQAEASQRISSSPALKQIALHAEQILSRALTPTDLKLILWCSEMLSLPDDVLFMLFDFCKKRNHTDTAYLKETATRWWENEINSHDKAELYLAQLEHARTTMERMRKILEFGDKEFTPYQKGLLEKWTAEWGFSDGLVTAAYQCARNAEVSRVFPYMNKILTDWHEQGVETPEQMLAFEEQRKKQLESEKAAKAGRKSAQKPKKQTSYEMDEINQLLQQFDHH